MSDRLCRLCSASLSHTVVDLGMSPLCETFIEPHQLDLPEAFYPLHAYICEQCYLVQLSEYVSPEHIYSDYPYFSSYSESWKEHARHYCDSMIKRFELGSDSLVMEIASNDGYLLQNFVRLNIPCLGIEPAANVAKVAIEQGVETEVCFFGDKTAHTLAAKTDKPDLLIGNNVLAHVPNLNDFISGMKTLLKSSGVITMEFPHLLRLMQENQFDTIYHEHFSYLSFLVVEKAFSDHGLTIFDVEELATHGGSLRVFARHTENDLLSVSERVNTLREKESAFGIDQLDSYAEFENNVWETKRKLLTFLIDAKRSGKQVVGYGAPGKGNTLLNYCGIGTDFLDYTVDRSPHKQGRFTPGTRIPIFHPDKILETRPDYVLILPWNLSDEISQQMSVIREWGGKFVVPIPEVKIL